MSRDMKMNILSPSHIICQSEIPRAPRLIVECRYVQWMNTILILGTEALISQRDQQPIGVNELVHGSIQQVKTARKD